MKTNSPKIYKTIGQKLRARRIKLGMSQRGLARKTNTFGAHIAAIEQAKIKVHIHTLIKICKVLGLRANKLF